MSRTKKGKTRKQSVTTLPYLTRCLPSRPPPGARWCSVCEENVKRKGRKKERRNAKKRNTVAVVESIRLTHNDRLNRAANNRPPQVMLQTIVQQSTSRQYQSFDFLPPLTPATTSSPRRKSGYLNPPRFGICVRHAAPSTGYARISPPSTLLDWGDSPTSA